MEKIGRVVVRDHVVGLQMGLKMSWNSDCVNHKSQIGDVVCLKSHLDDYFRFFEWFADAWRATGGQVKPDVRWPRRLRAAIGRPLGFAIGHPAKRLLVCACHRIESCAWPWNYGYEIVPVMWDLWPDYYEPFARFIRRNRVRTVFCTSSAGAAWIKERFPGVNCTWLPEAIDVRTFPCGNILADRPIDVLWYGGVNRTMPRMSKALERLESANCISAWRWRYDGGLGGNNRKLQDIDLLPKM